MEQNTLQIQEQDNLPKIKYIIELFGKIYAVESELILDYKIKTFASRIWQKLDNDYVCIKDRVKIFPDYKGKIEKFISMEDFLKISEKEIEKMVENKGHKDDSIC